MLYDMDALHRAGHYGLMAAYYAEKSIAAEAGHAVTTSADSSLYCVARWILGDCAYANGEYAARHRF